MCAGGARSAFAAKTLQEMDYKNVVSMDGGFNQWQKKSLPTSEGNLTFSQSDFIFSLSKWGFKTSQFNKVITGVQELTKNHENFEK